MRGNLPGPEGLAGRGASAALRGWSVVPLRPAPRALHPLPLPANAAHAKYSDRLLLRIVVLAAGFSARLGQPKALARIRGLSVLHRTIRTLLPFRAASSIIVVIPRRAVRYTLGFPRRSVAFVANADRATGLASSVRLGVRRARHSAGILLLPVDLVELKRRDIARLITRWRGARRRVAARRVEAHAGAPLILPRWLYARALRIAGDAGLRELVRRLPRHAVSLTDLPSAELDVDTPQDLERARRRTRPKP